MNKIRWGILGTGTIAHQFASDLKRVENAELVAVGSRSQQSAEIFSGKFDIPLCFGSYDGLVVCDEIDIIYCDAQQSPSFQYFTLPEPWKSGAL